MIPNFLDSLRLSSLFGNPSPTTPDTGVITNNDVSDDYGIQKRLAELFSPSANAQTELNNYMRSMPNRSDYQPGKFRQIAASVAGLGAGGPLGIVGGQPIGYRSDIPTGLKVKDAILNSEFNQALEDWETRLKPLSELTEAERAANTNIRLTGATLLRDEQARKSMEQREDAAEKRLQGQRESIAQRDRYLAFKKEQEANPNNVYKSDKDGRIFGINPKTNAVKYLTDGNGDFIEESDLPEAEKLRIQHNNRLNEIAAAGDEARETTITRGAESRKTKSTPTASQTNKGELPSQRKVRLYTKAVEAVNSHPEWKDYIEFVPGSSNDFRIIKPGPNAIGRLMGKKVTPEDEKTYKDILNFIYGNETPIDATSSHDSTAKPRVRADGKTYVRKKSSGETGWVTNPDLKVYEVIP